MLYIHLLYQSTQSIHPHIILYRQQQTTQATNATEQNEKHSVSTLLQQLIKETNDTTSS